MADGVANEVVILLILKEPPESCVRKRRVNFSEGGFVQLEDGLSWLILQPE